MTSGAPLWHAAAAFAAARHHGQQRRDGTTPYFAHTARVATVVSTVFGVGDEEVLAAAYLHDTIEDTDADFDDIRSRFGDTVAELVAALTKDMRLAEDLREVDYDAQLAGADVRARLIKLADVYDNLLDSTPERRGEMIEKVDRILALTADDAELRAARGALNELRARSTEPSVEPPGRPSLDACPETGTRPCS